MLRSTFYSFTTALSGMRISQKQLDVTGQNIANVSTVGYTRQRADVFSRAPAGYGDRYSDSNMLVGQGVKADKVSQYRDPFLDVRFRRESASAGEEEAKLGTMNDLAMIFDEIERGGLMTSFSDFVTKLQYLVNNAESPEFDNIARDSAQTLVNQFHYYANQMNTIREETEYNLREVTVGKLNDLMVNIANLNKSIQEIQSGGRDALELKDERNLLLDELSNYFKLDVLYTPNYLKGGVAIEDVTISMVGADGSKQPLIFNSSYSIFDVKTEGVDGTSEAIVTIDNSMLPADKAVQDINNLLRGATYQNGLLQDIKNEIAGKENIFSRIEEPGTFTLAEATSEELVLRLQEIADSTYESIVDPDNGLDARIKGIDANIATTIAAYNAEKDAGTLDPDKIKAYRETVEELRDERTVLEQQRIAAAEAVEDLRDYLKVTKKAVENLKVYDNALNKYMQDNFDVSIDPDMMWNEGDYSSCYYTLKDANGNTLKDDQEPPQEIKWYVGKATTQIDRDDLAQIGIVFEDKFDAEAFGSPGALKGTLEMLNSDGIFEFDATATKGIGFYEKMLNTLADQLAGVLNGLNDNVHTKDVNEKLFETSDGSEFFTAENIKISEGWLNGEYGITKTQDILPGDNSGSSDNILLMISAITSRLEYKTDAIPKRDQDGRYIDADGNVLADAVDAQGNYILTKDYALDPPVEFDPPRLIANKDFITYTEAVDANGERSYTLDADVLEAHTGDVYIGADGKYLVDDGTLTEGEKAAATKATGTFFLDDEGNLVADGRDEYGNYTLSVDAEGNEIKPPIVTANQDGIIYQLDAQNKIQTQPDGKALYKLSADAAAAGKTTSMAEDFVTREPSFIYNGTFQEYLGNIANVLSLDISSTSNLSANHEAVLNEIQTSKESLSSVSLDEEGVNIMQYQKAYNASARLMTALDEILDKLINSTGVVGR